MLYTRCTSLGVAATLLLAAGAGAQTVVTFTPDKDNTLIEMAGLPDLSSGRGDLFAGGIAQQNELGNAYRRRALMHFNLSSIPQGAIISSVTLQMRMTKTIAGTYQFNLYRMLADWGEGLSNSGTQGTGVQAQTGDATWKYRFYGTPSSAWTNQGGDFAPEVRGSAMVGAVGTYTFTGSGLKVDVQSWVNGTQPNNGWLLTSDLEFLTSIAKRFTSREGTGSNRPTLTVTYTLPPACGPQDYNGDGDPGTDADIEAFFACLGGNCCQSCWFRGSDFNGDGDYGTDQDIEAFFRVLGGGSC